MRHGACLIGPLLLAVATGGCAGEPAVRTASLAAAPITGRLVESRPETRTDIAGVTVAIASAAAQVKRCYRQPSVPSAGRGISTRLRIRLSVDGSLTDVPTILEQFGVNEANRAFAGRMAEAASLAVMRCAPLRLPAELYAGGWDEFVLTFSPAMLV